ncbi:MAG: hypothetical protein AAF841_12735 [Pseudomonadota bacterium]
MTEPQAKTAEAMTLVDGSLLPGGARFLEDLKKRARAVCVLCDLLEALADDLPRLAKGPLHQARTLCAGEVPRYFRQMNDGLIPAMRGRLAKEQRDDADQPLCDLLDRLAADLGEDDARLSEIIDMLDGVTDGSANAPSEETLGFAFRSYFEAMRRQRCWEDQVLFPLAARTLTHEDLVLLELRFPARAPCAGCSKPGGCAARMGLEGAPGR